MKPSNHILIGCCLIAGVLLTGCSRPKAQMPVAALAKALAENDLSAVRAAVTAGCEALGRKAGEPEVADEFRRVMNKDHAMESLLLVNRIFKHDSALPRDTQSTEALDAIGRLVSEEARRGKQPLGPGAWGLFLEFVVAKSPAGP